jgi:hypothetical protein
MMKALILERIDSRMMMMRMRKLIRRRNGVELQVCVCDWVKIEYILVFCL